MKPLYLESRKGIRVLLDGKTLLVRREGDAERIFPVNRLSRVVSHVGVDWDSKALLALAGEGIPTVFIDEEGAVAARVLGSGGERASLVLQLEELLSRADGVDRYEDWRAHHHREQLLSLSRQYSWIGGLPDPDRMRGLLVERLNGWLERQEVVMSLKHLHARTLAWSSERLSHLGVGAQTPHLTGGVIDLPSDLAEILQWRISVRWTVLLRRYPAARGTFADQRRRQRWLTWFYQQLEPSLEKEGRRLLARLHLWAATQDCP